MGLESREYLRDDNESWRGQPAAVPMSIVTKIIIATVAVWVIQLLSIQGDTQESIVLKWLALDSETLFQGQIWRLLTYAFLHAVDSPMHIAFNMLMLFFMGRQVAQLTGPKEFLWFYCVSAIFAGICSVCFYHLMGAPFSCIGASGAVLAVFTLLVMHYPHQKIYIWGLIGIEARWLLAAFVAFDAFPVVEKIMTGNFQAGGTAHSAHLGGMIFGWLYFRWQMRFTTWWDRFAKRTSSTMKVRKSGLKVYHPDTQPEADLRARVDTILAKISDQGEDSLTNRERRILKQASEQLKRRK